jgi:hypothetical protein
MTHSRSSCRKFGGSPEDYIKIHEKIDSSKIAHAEVSHRCIFHSAFGIYLVEELFGKTILNSDGNEVSTRDIAEQHVLEDLGFIPSLSDWLHEMSVQPWMAGDMIAQNQGRRKVGSTPRMLRDEPESTQESDDS